MTDEELDALLPQLERAGLVKTYLRPDGQTGFRFTALGKRVGRMLAMSGDEGDIVLGDLLGTRPSLSGSLGTRALARDA